MFIISKMCLKSENKQLEMIHPVNNPLFQSSHFILFRFFSGYILKKYPVNFFGMELKRMKYME